MGIVVAAESSHCWYKGCASTERLCSATRTDKVKLFLLDGDATRARIICGGLLTMLHNRRWSAGRGHDIAFMKQYRLGENGYLSWLSLPCHRFGVFFGRLEKLYYVCLFLFFWYQKYILSFSFVFCYFWNF
jgi:hypothetical protein